MLLLLLMMMMVINTFFCVGLLNESEQPEDNESGRGGRYQEGAHPSTVRDPDQPQAWTGMDRCSQVSRVE